MRIVVDGRFLVGNPTGIGKYLIGAIKALSECAPLWQFIIVVPHIVDSEVLFASHSNVQFVVASPKYCKAIKIIWFFTTFNSILKQLKPDIVWYPGALGLPCKSKYYKEMCTVHDFVYKEFPESMTILNRITYNLFMKRTVNRADYILANSQHTADKIDYYCPNRKQKKILVGMSIDQQIFYVEKLSDTNKNNLLKKIGVENRSNKNLLFVGTIEPRKNLSFLLQLMPELAKRHYNLIIVGGKGWYNCAIKEIYDDAKFPRENVCFAGYLTDDQIRHLYNICDCYVSPSLYEGFGMPQLEAIFCGAKVVSASNTAMIEVVNDAGILVEGWDLKQWIEKIDYCVNTDVCQIKYHKKREEYSWLKIANCIKEYLKE